MQLSGSSWWGWGCYRNSVMDTAAPESIRAGGTLPPKGESLRQQDLNLMLDKSGEASLDEKVQER